ncbi:MAG TPA: S8 family serine peptidase, partial [Pyrinomonadaceae bacterium]|nr:S8 family serine peptidase [Pyrinomonadaceae bacterium]
MKREKRIERRIGWRWATALGLSLSLLAGLVVSESAKAQTRGREERPVTSLQKYTTDLTAAAEQGRFNSIDVPAESADRAIEILTSRRKNNPVVISDSQSTRDMVIIGVAVRIANGNVPDELKAAHLYKLNLNSLFKDSKTADELNNTLSAILTDVTNADSKSILIVDPIQSLIGPAGAFDGAASAVLREALRNDQVRCFGASSQAAFDQNVGNQESLAAYFATVAADESTAASEATKDKENLNREDFVGDNISPDLRALMNHGNAPSRVKAILQVDDVNNSALRAQLESNGVKVDSQMARFGILSVDMPAKAVEKLAANSATRYLSLDSEVQASGHVEDTVGESAMWSQSGNSGFDGSGVGIAIVDSGITPNTPGLDNIVFNQDFTGEGRTSDPYGHGTFVASVAAGNMGSYGGVAPAASILNFRVLNSTGAGKLSAVLSALNSIAANRTKYNIRVVNLSLGMPATDTYKNDPLCRA